MHFRKNNDIAGLVQVADSLIGKGGGNDHQTFITETKR